MEIGRSIRTEELEVILRQLEGALNCELSLTSPSGELLAGRALSKEQEGVEEVMIHAGGGSVGLLRCKGWGSEPGSVLRLAKFITSMLERELESRRGSRELLSSLAQSSAELQFFYEMSASLRATMGVQQTCEVILDQVSRLTQASRASIMLFGEGGDLYIQAARGIPAEVVARARIRVGEGIAGWVAQNERPAHVEDVRFPPPELSQMLGKTTVSKARSFVSVPLLISSGLGATMGGGKRGRLLGVLNLTDRNGDEPFTASDVNLLCAVAAQAAVAIENSLLVQKSRHIDKLDDQLEVAARLQRALLPNSDPVFAGLDVSARSEPAAIVSGDYHDFGLQDPRSFRAIIADASVDGISAAILMSALQASVRSIFSVKLSPAQVLEHLNNFLCVDLASTGVFATAFVLDYAPKTGLLRYANAGHGRQLLCRASGEVQLLGDATMAAGVVEQTSYQWSQLPLQSGDVLALMTEGLPEGRSPMGEVYGLERLGDTLGKNRHLPARQISKAILQALRQFCQDNEEQGDRTLIVIKVAEPEDPA